MSRFCNIYKDQEGWFISDNQESQFRLPGGGLLDKLWEIASMLLDVTNDDCGANLNRARKHCMISSKRCREMSKTLDAWAEEYAADILYKNDESEPWWNK